MIAWGWKLALLEWGEGILIGPHYESWFSDHQNPLWHLSWSCSSPNFQFESHSWVEAELDESYLRDD